MMEREVYQEEEVYDMGVLGDPHDDEDEEETLSFCDLPIYNGGDDAEKESTTDHASSRSNNQSSSQSSFSSSLNDNDDDCFDFSFSSSQTLQEKNIIVFCGKIIRPPLPNINSNYYYYCKELQLLKDNNKSTTSSFTPKPKGMPPTKEKKTCHARKNIPSSSATAKYKNKTSKWYMLMLGLARIHQGGNMELKDIKKRQTKRSHSRRLKIANNNKSYSAGSSRDHIEMKEAGNNKVGLLSLLRSFSCTRSPTNDVDLDYCKVKASLWWLQQLRTPH